MKSALVTMWMSGSKISVPELVQVHDKVSPASSTQRKNNRGLFHVTQIFIQPNLSNLKNYILRLLLSYPSVPFFGV